MATASPLPNVPDLSELLPPIGTQEVWAAGVTYYRSREARMEEAEAAGGSDLYDHVYHADRPELFFKGTARRVVGPGGRLRLRRDSLWMVPEPELTLALNAAGAVVGYTIGNDVSARVWQLERGGTQWNRGKGFDTFAPLGPVLVTPDEIGDVRNLDLELTVNGKTRQKANTSQMIFDVFELVSFCSHIMTLVPGDVIATGTPSGVGAATGAFLAGGDEITCRIEKIGELTNTLGQPPESFYTPCKR